MKHASLIWLLLLAGCVYSHGQRTVGVNSSGIVVTPPVVSFQNVGFGILDTDQNFRLNLVPGSNLTANRTLTIITGDADATLTFPIVGGGAGVTDGDKGAITVSGGGTLWAIDPKAVTLGMLADGTAGRLITYDASGVITTVLTGTVGQALLSNGAGAAPSFQTLPGGGDALTSNPLSQFASTTSPQLYSTMSTKTGTGGLLVFGNGPTLVDSIGNTPTNGESGFRLTTIQYVTNAVAALGDAVTVGSGVLTGGTTYVMASPTPAYATAAAYPDFMVVFMKVNTANLGGGTFAAIGSGPSNEILRPTLAALSANDTASGSLIILIHNATTAKWILQTPHP